MHANLKILILEDNGDDAELVRREIVKAGIPCVFELAMDKNSFLEILDRFSPNIILSDNSLPQFNSQEALLIARRHIPDIPFILVTGTVSEEYAVNITKSGADDYILKDRLARLPSAIETANSFRNAERAKKIAADKLIASEEKYRLLVARITDAFIALDTNWNYTYLNQKATAMFEPAGGDLIGRNVWEVFPEAIGGLTYLAFHKAMAEQQYVCSQDYFAPARLWLENHIYPSKDGLSIFTRDISESKKAEEEIKKANERFEMVVAATNDVVWDWDLVTNGLWWNQNYYTHFGYERSNTASDVSAWKKGIYPDDRDRVVDGIYLSIKNRRSVWTDEYRFMKADGGLCHILDCGYILYDHHGNPNRMVGAMLDITLRKKAEQQLQQSFEDKHLLAERVSAIVNTLPANIALLDRRGIIIDVNESWKKFAFENSYAGADYGIGDNYMTISGKANGTEKEDGENVAAGVKAVLDGKMPEFVYEYPCHGPHVKRWFRMVVSALDEKNLTGAVVMHIDISEVRQLEHERMQLKTEELKKITRAILDAQEKERNLIGLELHDNVNQILAGTKLLLSTAQKYPEKAIEVINDSIINLQDAIDENRKIAHNLVVHDFNEVNIKNQLSNLTDSMLRTAGLDVYTDTSQLNEALLDDDQKLTIFRIAQEQCTNIIKYAKAQVINISLRTLNKLFQMSIQDDGVGMANENVISGIGLRNIKSRLGLFNGDIVIETARDKGFILSVSFPLTV